MPATLYQIPDHPGPVDRFSRSRVMKRAALVLIFTCDDCGGPGTFGVGVKAGEAMATGDMSKAGRWYCGWVDGEPVCLVNPASKAAESIPDQFLPLDREPRLFG